MLKKLGELLKKIPNIYYNWKKRNENLATFLEEAKENKDRLENINTTMITLNKDIQNIKEKVHTLGNQMEQVNGRLETIGQGTMMELFDTLHSWRTELVVERKWASPSEKREVENIFNIYHHGLHGNGQGVRYYNEIMSLPESEEELQQLHGGK